MYFHYFRFTIPLSHHSLFLTLPRISRRFKDGEEIKPDDERIKTSVNKDGLAKLSIEKVDVNDCGAYKVVATNDLGKSIANTAVVVNRKLVYW